MRPTLAWITLGARRGQLAHMTPRRRRIRVSVTGGTEPVVRVWIWNINLVRVWI